MVEQKTPKDAKNEARALEMTLEAHGHEMDADTKLQLRVRQLALEGLVDADKKADQELKRRALESLKAKDPQR